MNRTLSFLLVFRRALHVAAVLGAIMTTGCTTHRDFAFGIVADVQYAQKEKAGTREYRAGKDKLARAVEYFNNEKLAFVVQFGDMIDGGETAEQDLRAIAEVYNGLKAPKYNVLGNHDFSGLDRKTAMAILGMDRAFYDFTYQDWRFVVLDTMDLAVSGGWPSDSLNYKLGKQMLDQRTEAKAPNAQSWNGGIGPAQKQWLDYILKDAAAQKQKVVIFAHHPLMPAGDRHNLWNDEEIVALLESHKCLVAWFNGHKHFCEYHYKNGKYYITFDGMVEDAFDKGWAVATVRKDRIEIESTGKVPRLALPLEQ
jgi:3',5'-cyclic AMP phosphodiesterase CpdA